MKFVILTQNQVALVDDEDYERVSKFKWHVAKTYDQHAINVFVAFAKTNFPMEVSYAV